jgi:molybdopterin-guanine dinucleotide biosynthesis protein A
VGTTLEREIAGVVLAGGLSTRFGADKASALLGGRPLLQWVVAALGEVVGRVVVVRAAEQALPAVDSPVPLAVVEDEVSGRGPLAGLVAGFRAAGDAVCLTASCDAPLLRPAVLRRMLDCLGDADAVMAEVAGFRQPFAAAYRAGRCLPAFERALAAGAGSVLAAAEAFALRVVPGEELRDVDPALESFRNVNTRADLAAIEAALAKEGRRCPAGPA